MSACVEGGGVGQRAGVADLREQLGVLGAQEREQLGLEAAHLATGTCRSSPCVPA